MKAELTGKGLLTVTPETELEAYALLAWWEHWQPGSGHDGANGRLEPSAFAVQLAVPQSEGKP